MSASTAPRPDGRPRGGNRVLVVFDKAITWVASVSDHLSALICALLIVVTTLTVVGFEFDIAFAWMDDVMRTLLIWLVYLGTVSLCLKNDHISMDALYLHMPLKMRKVVDVVVALMGIILCGFITKIGYATMMQDIRYGTLLDSGYIPAWPLALSIPLCFGLMTVAYLSYLFAIITGRHHRLSEEEKMAEGV